jgi:MSHA biogenesis protein MshK
MRRWLSMMTVLSLPAVADALADPTQPPPNWGPAESHGASATVAPRLSSILVSENRRVAVIDGVAYREGQTSNGITVVRIDKAWVDTQVGSQIVRLKLGGANMTNELR